jgi:predicted metal-dependent peptidase
MDTMGAQMQSAVSQGLFMQKQKCPETARKFGALTTPKVDWKKALAAWLSARQFGYDLTNWKRRSRRGMATGYCLPQRYEERTGRLVVAVDTSGSIGNPELMEFLSEVGALAKTLNPKQVELLYWGSEIAGHETYLPAAYGTMTNTTRPMDGGGTRIMAVREWLQQPAMKDVTGVVILTDGYVGAWGEGGWPCPTFVVLNTGQPCPMTHVRL